MEAEHPAEEPIIEPELEEEAEEAVQVEEQPAPLVDIPEQPVLVTGAAGLVGSHACQELARRGWKIRALVRDPRKAAARLARVPVQLTTGDIRDRDTLLSATRDTSAVVHLAAIAIERPGQSYEQVNAEATSTLLDAASANGVDRFIHMSQNGASSTSPYRFLRSKGIAEDRVRESDRRWTVLRPSVIFGPEDEFVNVLARLVRLTPFVFPLPGGGTARFQPVAVDDVARAIGVALERPETVGGTYALGGPAALTLRQMVERVLLAMDEERTLVSVPIAVLYPLVALAERVLPNPPVTTSLLDLLNVDNTVSDSALKDVFGISPTPFAPEEIGYLKQITVGDALRSIMGA
jgi:uncharacterized protein YbjT (DUF2867 family)